MEILRLKYCVDSYFSLSGENSRYSFSAPNTEDQDAGPQGGRAGDAAEEPGPGAGAGQREPGRGDGLPAAHERQVSAGPPSPSGGRARCRAGRAISIGDFPFPLLQLPCRSGGLQKHGSACGQIRRRSRRREQGSRRWKYRQQR